MYSFAINLKEPQSNQAGREKAEAITSYSVLTYFSMCKH